MRNTTSTILQFVPFSSNLPTVMLATVERIKSRLQSYLASDSSFSCKTCTRIVENLDGTQLMMSSTAKARFTICRIASSCRGIAKVVISTQQDAMSKCNISPAGRVNAELPGAYIVYYIPMLHRQ